MRQEKSHTSVREIEGRSASNPDSHFNDDSSCAPRPPSRRVRWLGPIALFGVMAAVGAGLVWWKARAQEQAMAAAANQPEYSEVVTVATARQAEYQRTTTSIGTIVALRSLALRNEVAGTVATANLTPGEIVEAGTVLVAFDVSVEQAELKAQEAQANLARTFAERMERAVQGRATSQIELDRAHAELDVAQAQIARIEAVIARKTLCAPFRARIGLSDIHPGQYLNEGTLITSLQGVDETTQVDFAVPQAIAETLEVGDSVSIVAGSGRTEVSARIIALDARVDPATRNITARARVEDAGSMPPPGASVRVAVPSAAPLAAVAIPVNALRKGPSGDHVFLVVLDQEGKPRSQTRQVTAGPVLGDEALILSGLEPGDRVASFGSFKLMEGTLLTIAERPEGQSAAAN